MKEEKKIILGFVLALVFLFVLGGVALWMSSWAYTARGETIRELRVQVTVLNQQLQEMEAQLQAIPSITVLSPNGGEEWTVNESYEIAWTQVGLEGKEVDILLLGYNEEGNRSFEDTIVTGVSANEGYYYWYWTPDDIADMLRTFSFTPTKYKIEVLLPPDIETSKIITDTSDGYFRIVTE